MPHWIETELKLLLPDEAAYARVRAALGPGRAVRQTNHFFDRADGALRTARIGVRLRAEQDERWLTLKGEAGSAGDALSRRIELETGLSDAAFEAAITAGLDLIPWLTRFRGDAGPAPLPPALEAFLARLESIARDQRLLRYAGFSNLRRTERVVLHDEQGPIPVEIALDRTELPGDRIDHEVEVELECEGLEAIAPPIAPSTADSSGPGDAQAPALAGRTARALARWLADHGVPATTPASSKLARLHEALTRQSPGAGPGSAAESRRD